MSKMHVHIIKMGGTIEFIDPAYDEINKNLLRLDTSIESYLGHLIQPHFSFSSEQIVQKDSRDITDDDREKLAQAIEASSHANIVITHGTFTMAATARYLEERGIGDKKVILTGSMVPLTGFAASDAGFNLGFTIASFSGVEPGVYVCMNGGVFNPDEVAKNETTMRFE